MDTQPTSNTTEVIITKAEVPDEAEADDLSATTPAATITNLIRSRMAYNLAGLGARPLNTAETAKQCKRIMTAYGIGQCLFADIVLQGKVAQPVLSTMLASPGSWDEMSVKRQEAFRRIFGSVFSYTSSRQQPTSVNISAWLSDDKGIELLRSLCSSRY